MEASEFAAGVPPRYRVECVVGRGGFGVVLRAHDTELDRPVAIKRLLRDAQDSEAHARFRREAQRTARLRHPHVIQVLDFGVEAGEAPYLVYEWVDGRDLSALRERPSVATLREWGVAVAEALAAAHEAGIVHRDVKPANLLLREDGHLLVTDLGIARVSDGESVRTAEGIILGSPPYMAPELFHGTPASPASDQWAWAASLVELAGGGPVWGTDDLQGILSAVGSPRTFSAGAIDPGLAGVLKRALAWAPEDRFTSMETFAAALGGSEDAPATVAIGPGPAPVADTLAPSPRARRTKTPITDSRPPPASGRRSPSPPVLVGGLGTLGFLVAGVLWANGRFGASVEPPPRVGPRPAAAPQGEELDPNMALLERAEAALFASHRGQDGRFREDLAHRRAFQDDLGRDPRIPLRIQRWLDAAQAWLGDRAPVWVAANPDGPEREAYWELHRRIIGPLRHLQMDFFIYRRHRTSLRASMTNLSGRGAIVTELALSSDQEALQALEAFRQALGNPEAGMARFEIEAYLVSGSLAADYKGAPPPGVTTRRPALLEAITERLEGRPGPLETLQLAVATATLLRSYRGREVISPTLWDRASAAIAPALDVVPAQGAPDPEDIARAKLAVADGLVRSFVLRHRILRGPGPASAAEPARRALGWLARPPDLPDPARLATFERLSGWLPAQREYLTASATASLGEFIAEIDEAATP
jgi:serine/threonine-protein kinase